MKKIGIWLRYGYSPSTGGGFSYYDTLMKKLQDTNFDGFEICFITLGKKAINGSGIETIPLGIIPDTIPFLRYLIKKCPRLIKLFTKVNTTLFCNHYNNKLKNNNIDLLYYVIQGEEILPDYPFVFTIWDMAYYVTYPFPELIKGRNFLGRKKTFDTILKKAIMVFSESEAGKKDLVKYANVLEKKIRIVPLFAGNVINLAVPEKEQQKILAKYELQTYKYFFYPAQYWAHKNHVTLLKAFRIFYENHSDFKLVLTGSDKGNKEHIINVCRMLGLSESVLFMGFVKNEEIFTFYKNANSLIMASFFGPTNMPPIEAMNLGCPVICSDTEGHKEIMSDAALYFNSIDETELSNAMEKMTAERSKYVELSGQRSELSIFNVHYAITQIERNLSEALKIRSTWN